MPLEPLWVSTYVHLHHRRKNSNADIHENNYLSDFFTIIACFCLLKYFFHFSIFYPACLWLHASYPSVFGKYARITTCIYLLNFYFWCLLFYTVFLYSTLLYSTLLYSTLLYTTLFQPRNFYSTLHYCNLLYFTLLYSSLLYTTLLNSTQLCSMLCYTTLCRFTLFHFVSIRIIKS